MGHSIEADKIYGTVAIIDGCRYVFDGTSTDLTTAKQVAESERQEGRKARVLKIPRRGFRDSSGHIRREPYAIFVCWE